MLLKWKASRRNMADVNEYTASRLGDMASSLSRLARAFAEDGENGCLSGEDARMAMETAAATVCGSCRRCGIASEFEEKGSYYLYYLLRAFEKNGRIGEENMPRHFSEICPRREAYVAQLNRNLGRATMNLSWKNRFLESRDAVVIQFRELAAILEEFAKQMESASNVTASWEEPVKRAFRRNHIAVDRLLMLEYENHRKEAYLTVHMAKNSCITAGEAAHILSKALGTRQWKAARDSRNVIGRQPAVIRLVEEGSYQMLYGAAWAARDGQKVSGDNYTFSQNPEGQAIMSLSDGMGSGEKASQESRRVIELTEQLLETGFSARAALKLVNTVLLLTDEQHPATLDLCCIDLNTGELEAMKLGASATFIKNEDGVEILEASDVPMGVLNPIEPILLSKKLWDNNRIFMVSDGVLDSLPGEDKEGMLREFLEGQPFGPPKEMAGKLLEFAASFGAEIRDDMTVLAAGIWKRRQPFL